MCLDESYRKWTRLMTLSLIYVFVSLKRAIQHVLQRKLVLVDGSVGLSSGNMYGVLWRCLYVSWLHPMLSESLSCLFTSEFAGVWNRWYSWSDVSLGHVADPTATNYDPGIPDLFPIWATKDQNYKYFKVSTAFT